MDYIILSFAVLCFATQFAFNKAYEGCIKQTTITALVLPAVIGIVGSLQYLILSGFSIKLTTPSILLAIAMAAAFIPCYVIGIKVLSVGSLAIYSMFMMLGGMLVPFFYGILLLNEEVSLPRAVGSILLTAFIILQAQIQNSSMAQKSKASKKDRTVFLILCIAIFFLNGMTGVIAKMHEMQSNPISEANYTFLYSVFSAVISLALLALALISKTRGQKIKEIRTTLALKPMLFMVGLGVMTNTGNFLLLKAAANLPASVQFPFTSGGVILLSALYSALIFREQISKKEWITVLGASLATVLFLF